MELDLLNLYVPQSTKDKQAILDKIVDLFILGEIKMSDPSTPKHGHVPITMKRVAGYGDLKNVGDFYWTNEGNVERIALALPSPTRKGDGHYTLCHIPVGQDNPTSQDRYW